MAYLFWKHAPEFQADEEIRLQNPFQLGMAIKFGVFLVSILLLSKVLKIYFGDMGAYVLAAVSGLADVDPITLSMSQMSKAGLGLEVAAHAILIAAAVNSVIKSIVAFVIGDRALGLRVGATLAIAVVAGLMIA